MPAGACEPPQPPLPKPPGVATPGVAPGRPDSSARALEPGATPCGMSVGGGVEHPARQQARLATRIRRARRICISPKGGHAGAGRRTPRPGRAATVLAAPAPMIGGRSASASAHRCPESARSRDVPACAGPVVRDGADRPASMPTSMIRNAAERSGNFIFPGEQPPPPGRRSSAQPHSAEERVDVVRSLGDGQAVDGDRRSICGRRKCVYGAATRRRSGRDERCRDRSRPTPTQRCPRSRQDRPRPRPQPSGLRRPTISPPRSPSPPATPRPAPPARPRRSPRPARPTRCWR